MIEQKLNSISDVLDAMPKIAETIERHKQRGLPFEWISKPADTTDPYTLYLKNGRLSNGYRAYPSICNQYLGLWLNGGMSAVHCSAVSFPLPGIVHDLYCKSNCAECPLAITLNKGEKQ